MSIYTRYSVIGRIARGLFSSLGRMGQRSVRFLSRSTLFPVHGRWPQRIRSLLISERPLRPIVSATMLHTKYIINSGQVAKRNDRIDGGEDRAFGSCGSEEKRSMSLSMTCNVIAILRAGAEITAASPSPAD